jgi:hypothetical protein
VPSIIEGFYLCARFFSSGAAKENVVVRLAIEWRIEVNEIYAFIVNAATKYGEVVAVIEFAWQLNRLPIFCASRS